MQSELATEQGSKGWSPEGQGAHFDAFAFLPYRDPVSTSYSFQEIVGFLERQYDDILAEESRIKRNPRFRDNRVHALLYFIAPGHSLREMDIELMRRLSPRVNVIPVIGKSDSMTPDERALFKKRVSSNLH